jgi:hypothetical protein
VKRRKETAFFMKLAGYKYRSLPVFSFIHPADSSNRAQACGACGRLPYEQNRSSSIAHRPSCRQELLMGHSKGCPTPGVIKRMIEAAGGHAVYLGVQF